MEPTKRSNVGLPLPCANIFLGPKYNCKTTVICPTAHMRLTDVHLYAIFPDASLSSDMASYAVTIYSLSQFSQHGCILDIPSSLEVHHSPHHQIPLSVETGN